MSGKIVTANRLGDGLVVYLDTAGGWSEYVEAARVAQSEEQSAEILALAEVPAQATLVVGPYLMDVSLENGEPRAVSNREIIRAKGPTVHPNFGKQAEGQDAG